MATYGRAVIDTHGDCGETDDDGRRRQAAGRRTDVSKQQVKTLFFLYKKKRKEKSILTLRIKQQPASSLASLLLFAGLKRSIRLDRAISHWILQEATTNQGRRTVVTPCQPINWWFGRAETPSQVSHPLPRTEPVLLHAFSLFPWLHRHCISCANKAFHLAV